ncbi:MAG: GGDEF domain-containing protein [Desulfobacula sp.]|nr:GGDEF domain-containing protein [Desulfobacula sp.]MCK5349939.1 GGDEF domain-containing protein [Desulfobacula sp.]
MNYAENNEQAGEYLRLALVCLAKYNLAANPINLTIFYEYVSGKNTALKQSIDKDINASGKISLEKLEGYYKTHIVDGERIIFGRLILKLNLILKDLSNHLIDTTGGFSVHGKKLGHLAEQIDGTQDHNNLINIVDQMVVETKAIISSGKRMQKKINGSYDDLQILNQELKKSQEQARTDALTGLANRRWLDQKLELEKLKSLQTKSVFSIIMLDIDHFKKINDDYGHLVGDNVLKTISRMLQKHVRKNDFVSRIGGEEFLILMPDTNLTDACIVAVKIKNSFSNRNWKLKESGLKIKKVTASMGIAQYRFHELNNTLLKRADDALYLAKTNGRDLIKTEKEI